MMFSVQHSRVSGMPQYVFQVCLNLWQNLDKLLQPENRSVSSRILKTKTKMKLKEVFKTNFETQLLIKNIFLEIFSFKGGLYLNIKA